MSSLSASVVAFAASFELDDASTRLLGDVRLRVARAEDTFASIAREEGVGYEALLRINPDVDAWLPEPGTRLVLPTSMLLPDGPPAGIVINLSELRLYFFEPGGENVAVYPIGIGSEGRETPLMTTRTVAKLENPAWYPPDSVRARHAENGTPLPGVVLPGPDNPLGSLAIKLAAPGYFIHGTNQPIGVGRRISAGCIRMYEPHIEALVTSVANGTSVRVIKQPFKAAWHDGRVYLEAHPAGTAYTDAVRQVLQATAERPADVDWERVLEVARAATGVPAPVTR